MKVPGRGIALLLAALAAGCAPEIRAPDLATIYRPAADIQGPERLPLIGLPGTLGSILVDKETATEIWGGRDRLSVDPNDPMWFRKLALPVGDGTVPNHTLRDSVATAGVLRAARVSVFGVPIEVDVYSTISNTLRYAGWIEYEDPLVLTADRQTAIPPIPPPEANGYPFAYDWRRDLVQSVKLLDAHVRKKAEQEALKRGFLLGTENPVRFNLIAHSMGTLIARYYLMYGTQDLPEDGSLPELTWEGAKFFEKAVFVAPPNAGSITAFENLVNGKSLGPVLPFYSPVLLGTHFSTYALMPRSRHARLRWADTNEPVEDLYDPALWERMGWGLANPAADPELAILMPDVTDPAERRRRALLFLKEALTRARQFQAALDREERSLPEGLAIHLVVGGSFRTPAGARVDRRTGAVVIDQFEEGDGVVLRASSLLDERQGGPYRLGLRTPLAYSSTLFLPREHVQLTQDLVFGDNLLFWLTEGRRAPETLATATEAETMRVRTAPGLDNRRVSDADK